MLYYALVFLVVGLIAGVLGVSGVAGVATNIAYVLFVIAIVLFIVHLLSGVTHAAGARQQPHERAQQGGLARAVGADHRPPLARRHRQRDVVERAQRAEAAGHARELQRVARRERPCGRKRGD